MSTLRLSLAVVGALFSLHVARSEVIYDNTQFILSGYASDARRYGDQVDLEGTARTLTDLTFYYYGDFIEDGNETMKVRLYSNETPYDSFRKAPTTLLYESGNMPCQSGYNSRTISNLRVKLPLDTVTFTFEFGGLKTNEIAGLLLYGPPTIGWSFNEFWGQNPDGSWATFYYSFTDPTRKANAGLKLVARTEADLPLDQTNAAASISMRGSTNSIRLAQTFVAKTSGRLDLVNLALDWAGLPAQLSILDTIAGVPGTNLLATQTVTNSEEGRAVTSFYENQVYLNAGTQYAIECKTANPPTDTPQYTLLCSTNDAYADGKLWSLAEPSGDWLPASLTNSETDIDAVFSLSVIPSAPPVRITSPGVGEIIPFGASVQFTVELNLPQISELWRIRFFDGDNQIDELLNPPHQAPPHEILWKATNAGIHHLKVLVLDKFNRPFRTERRTVTVLPAPPSLDRIVSIRRKADEGVSLSFDTVDNEHIRIEYSEDLEHWKAATVQADGTGSELIYEDDGPPKTDRHPKETRQRYYRLIFGQ